MVLTYLLRLPDLLVKPMATPSADAAKVWFHLRSISIAQAGAKDPVFHIVFRWVSLMCEVGDAN